MNYDNFESLINPTILDRGRNYFAAGAVTSLEKEDGVWWAEVASTEVYEVSITGIRKIKDWHCDCPYDQGPVCKHLVAVLYSIQEKKLETRTSRPKKTNEIKVIFDKATPEELLRFFQKKISRYKDLKNELLVNFSHLLEEGDAGKYQNMIKSFAKAAQGRYGFIDYKDSFRFTKPVLGLMSKAEKFLADKNYVECFAICSAVIPLVTEQLESMDDSSGQAGNCIYLALNCIKSLLVEVKAYELRDKILDFLFEGSAKKKYSGSSIEYQMFDILAEHLKEKKQIERLEQILIKKIDSTNWEYAKESYLMYLFQLYTNTKQEEKIASLQEKYINLSFIRKLVIDQYIATQQLDEAKQLIQEGILLAVQQQLPGLVNTWKKKQLEIVNLDGNVEESRQILNDLYFGKHGHSSEYFQALKKTYSEEEWIQIRKGIIKKVQSKKTYYGYYDYQHIGQLYMEEQMWEELLRMLQLKGMHSNIIFRFGQYLEEFYPTEILSLYEPELKQYAEQNMGRSHYKKLAEQLKSIKKIKGGKAFVEKLLTYFREKYIKRPAMVEELSKV